MTNERLAQLRAKATRHRKTVAVLLDGEVREQIEAVEDELDRLAEQTDNDTRLGSKGNAARIVELEVEREHLREAALDSTFCAVLEGLQRTTFRALLAQHPVRVDAEGRQLPADRIVGANADTIAIPLVRACLVGYREKAEADSPMLPLDSGRWTDAGYEPSIVEFLLGYRVEHPVSGLVAEAEPFATERQIDQLAGAAFTVCAGNDAVPLPRARSATKKSAGA